MGWFSCSGFYPKYKFETTASNSEMSHSVGNYKPHNFSFQMWPLDQIRELFHMVSICKPHKSSIQFFPNQSWDSKDHMFLLSIFQILDWLLILFCFYLFVFVSGQEDPTSSYSWASSVKGTRVVPLRRSLIILEESIYLIFIL